MLGTLVDGYEAYGPFRHEDHAHEFAESFGEEWYSTVIPMIDPDETLGDEDAEAALTIRDRMAFEDDGNTLPLADADYLYPGGY